MKLYLLTINITQKKLLITAANPRQARKIATQRFLIFCKPNHSTVKCIAKETKYKIPLIIMEGM